MNVAFGNDPNDNRSTPASVRKTKLATIFTLKEYAKPEKPGRSLSVVWDARAPLVKGFENCYSYVVRFTQPSGKAGNHFHKIKEELYFALHGAMTVVLEDTATKQREELQLRAGDNRCIYVRAGVAHVVVSKTDDDLLLVTATRHEASDDELPYVVVA